jgi:hypothetical protein
MMENWIMKVSYPLGFFSGSLNICISTGRQPQGCGIVTTGRKAYP